MYLLNNDQVQQIESDVERANITLTHLSAELVDHICCEVEKRMNEDARTFEEAYELVKETTGIRVLQSIQKNTLYLIDKKYSAMKNMMKISGNISLVLLATGTVLKITHLNGASIMLVTGFALLCLVFFPSAIYINYRDGKLKGKGALNISALVGGVAIMAGILFKVQHWSGAQMLLVTGWMTMIWIFLPLLLYSRLKETSNPKERRIYILGVIGLMVFVQSLMFKMLQMPGTIFLMVIGSLILISIFLPAFTAIKISQSKLPTGTFIFLIILSFYAIVFTFLLTMNPSKGATEHFVNTNNEASSIVRYYEWKNSQNKQVASLNPNSSLSPVEIEMKGLRLEADELNQFISKIRIELVKASELVDAQRATELIDRPDLIRMKENTEAVNNLLLGTEGESYSKTLKEKLVSFREHTSSITAADPELSNNIQSALSTSVDPNLNQTWEEMNFRNNPLISTLAYLTLVEKNVRVVESSTIYFMREQNQ